MKYWNDLNKEEKKKALTCYITETQDYSILDEVKDLNAYFVWVRF